MSKTATGEATEDGYTVRQFESGDREGFLDLYETVWGERPSAEWFDWRYGDNPFVDGVPVFVAESADGEIVGGRPLAAFEMHAGDETVTALHPSDTMVHPDHQGQGLFPRLLKGPTKHYTEGDEAFYFIFPNDAALKGSLKFGYREAGRLPKHYRVQNPNALLGEVVEGRPADLVRRVARPAAKAYHGVRDLLAETDDDLTVERYADAPGEVLAAIYEADVPDALHAVRSEEFYSWRFADPERATRAYVAKRGDEPVAAVVAYTETTDGVTRTKLADVQPMVDAPGRDAALRTVLKRLVADHADSDVIVAVGSAFPDEPLAALGFHRDDELPLSPLTTPTRLLTYPLTPGEESDWRVGDYVLPDRRDWLLTFAERDTS